MEYFLFFKDKDYTDSYGNKTSLDCHLDYLRRWGGTPDFYDVTTSLTKAYKIALACNKTVVIVEAGDYKIIEVVKYEPENVVF